MWKLCRSTIVTSAAVASALAAVIPPKPPPTMTIRWCRTRTSAPISPVPAHDSHHDCAIPRRRSRRSEMSELAMRSYEPIANMDISGAPAVARAAGSAQGRNAGTFVAAHDLCSVFAWFRRAENHAADPGISDPRNVGSRPRRTRTPRRSRPNRGTAAAPPRRRACPSSVLAPQPPRTAAFAPCTGERRAARQLGRRARRPSRSSSARGHDPVHDAERERARRPDSLRPVSISSSAFAGPDEPREPHRAAEVGHEAPVEPRAGPCARRRRRCAGRTRARAASPRRTRAPCTLAIVG